MQRTSNIIFLKFTCLLSNDFTTRECQIFKGLLSVRYKAHLDGQPLRFSLLYISVGQPDHNCIHTKQSKN